jgi:hypothetical protein
MRLFSMAALSLFACSLVWAQSQLPPRPSASPGVGQIQIPPKPLTQPAPDPCTDSTVLDSLMAKTQGILNTRFTSEAMAKYYDQENKSFGTGSSWSKVMNRVNAIQATEKNADANK